MKPGDMVKQKINQFHVWRGVRFHKTAGLIIAVDNEEWKYPHFDVLWNDNALELAVPAHNLEVLNE